MHDVGKIATPDSILLKPGKLTNEEFAIMREHTVHGYHILAGNTSEILTVAAEVALNHHERYDGAGYPNHIAGDAIPLSGRIVAVADVFDALSSKRPYKEAWPLEKARAYMVENRGLHFDPLCVDAFLSRWSEVVQIAKLHAEA
jgi:putative two-component system response regulator